MSRHLDIYKIMAHNIKVPKLFLEVISMRKSYHSLDLNNKLIWNFRDIGHTMRHISEGKGGQKRILIILLESGTMTQKQLTERLGIQPGSVSEVLGKLEAAGLITRTLSSSDHRTTDIILTEDGKKQAEEAAAQRRKRHDDMFSCLTDSEKATLLSLLEQLNSDWDSRYREKV